MKILVLVLCALFVNTIHADEGPLPRPRYSVKYWMEPGAEYRYGDCVAVPLYIEGGAYARCDVKIGDTILHFYANGLTELGCQTYCEARARLSEENLDLSDGLR